MVAVRSIRDGYATWVRPMGDCFQFALTIWFVPRGYRKGNGFIGRFEMKGAVRRHAPYWHLLYPIASYHLIAGT